MKIDVLITEEEKTTQIMKWTWNTETNTHDSVSGFVLRKELQRIIAKEELTYLTDVISKSIKSYYFYVKSVCLLERQTATVSVHIFKKKHNRE